MLTLSQGIVMPLCERFAGCEVHGREPDVRCVACDAALHSLCLFIQAKVPLPGKCNCTWCVPDEHGHNATCDVCKERFLTATGKTVCPDCRE